MKGTWRAWATARTAMLNSGTSRSLVGLSSRGMMVDQNGTMPSSRS
jgi:hypothetical protein